MSELSKEEKLRWALRRLIFENGWQAFMQGLRVIKGEAKAGSEHAQPFAQQLTEVLNDDD